jgi:5'-methylthioadenosine phosphorylase
MPTKIGIIGGSGLYDFEGFEAKEERRLETPFGAPSDAFVIGKLGGAEVVFLSRHGRGHRLSPSEINFRANIYGMKMLGVERVVSVSAVGSMRRRVRPGDLVLVDQFIDWTRTRERSFFGDGIVAHVALAEPCCGAVREHLARACEDEAVRFHRKGTYVCIEGPQFSMRAESELFRSFGVDVIGMTNMPEAKLAREAELCYATVALATDYDCWNEEHASVTVDEVVKTLLENVAKAKRVLARAIPALAAETRACRCGSALESAIMTSKDAIPGAARERLALLIGKRLSGA